MTLVAGSNRALGHVESAVKTNNRTIKLTVFGDRVRLATIIYFGEIPGALARQEMDRNEDGVLSQREQETFAALWARRVKDATEIRSGDHVPSIDWEVTDIGIDVEGSGAFSIDLVAVACVGAGPRRFEYRDQLVLPRAGESEILAEESPGTEITTLQIDGENATTLHWDGERTPLAARGLVLEWSADDLTESSVCKAIAARRQASRHRRLVVLGGAAAAAALAATLLWWQRKRRRLLATPS